MTQDIIDKKALAKSCGQTDICKEHGVSIPEDCLAFCGVFIEAYKEKLESLCKQQQRDIVALTNLNDNLIGPTRGEGAPEIGEIEYTPPGCETQQQQLDTKQAQIDDLSMIVRQLVCSLKKHNPTSGLIGKTTGYLKRHGLEGSLLRTAQQQQLDKYRKALKKIADGEYQEHANIAYKYVADAEEYACDIADEALQEDK